MTGNAHNRGVLPHLCTPGWLWAPIPDGSDIGFVDIPATGGMYGTPPSPRDFPAGTVWRCDCGQHWVSLGREDRLASGLCSWRRESRRERRKRLGIRWWQQDLKEMR